MPSGKINTLDTLLAPKAVRPAVLLEGMSPSKEDIHELDEAETTLFSLAQAVEKRDKSTGDHCHRLASLSVALGKQLRLPTGDLQALYRGGYLHDVGKVVVPDRILHKPGKLSTEEWEIMRQHPVVGEEICRPMKSLAKVLPIIRHHHERIDGGGYPDGLSGHEIPMLARVLQVVDIYDALLMERPYKPAFSKEAALQILLEEADAGWRDQEVVNKFVQLVEKGGISECYDEEFRRSLWNMHGGICRE